MPAGAADWQEVRRLWEQGLSAPAIEKQINRAVSRQAILKRARKEGWLQGIGQSQALVPQAGSQGGNAVVPVEPTEPRHLVERWAPVLAATLTAAGKTAASEETIKRALAGYAVGGTHKMAAAMGGLSIDTWMDWRNQTPSLEAAIVEIQASQAARHLERIDKAGARGDWKADEALLKANALTKDDWKQGDAKSGGVKIEITFGANMPPEAMKVIDAD